MAMNRHESSSSRVAAPVLPPLKGSSARLQLQQPGQGLAAEHEQQLDAGRWSLVLNSLLHANGLVADEKRGAQENAEGINILGDAPHHHLHGAGLLPLIAINGSEAGEAANETPLASQPLGINSLKQQDATTQMRSDLQKQESEFRDDYYVNVGYAIRTLREELPTLFYRDMTYDIYRDDIAFQDPMNTFRGLGNYRLIFKALRFHGKIFFRALWVDVLRVWQPNERTIQVRWSVRGIPRLPWEAQGRFDGTSEYKLDSAGKIYVHKMDNIVMSDPPKYQPLTVMELLRLSGANTTPTLTCSSRAAATASLASSAAPSAAPATPPLLSSPKEFLAEAAVMFSVLNRFTWVRFYCAIAGTLAFAKRRQEDGVDDTLPAPSG